MPARVAGRYDGQNNRFYAAPTQAPWRAPDPALVTQPPALPATTVAVGQAAELEETQPALAARRRPVAQVSESSAALPASSARAVTLSTPSDLSSSSVVSHSRRAIVATAAQSDVATTVVPVRRRAVSIAADVSAPMVALARLVHRILLGRGSESTEAEGLRTVRRRSTTAAPEADLARGATAQRAVAAATGEEAATTTAVGHARGGSAGLAVEIDERLLIVHVRAVQVQRTVSVDAPGRVGRRLTPLRRSTKEPLASTTAARPATSRSSVRQGSDRPSVEPDAATATSAPPTSTSSARPASTVVTEVHP